MSAHNYDSLIHSLAPDSAVLLLGEPDAALTQRFPQLERAEVGSLPTGDSRFALIVCRDVTAGLPDAFDLLRHCAGLLLPGGWLLVEDLLVPDDERAAFYVQAFYSLRAGTPQRYYAAYAWEGMLLDAGLSLGWQETDETRLLLRDWGAGCSDAVMTRLQILLHQAPAAVGDWLSPVALGSDAASFSQLSSSYRGTETRKTLKNMGRCPMPRQGNHPLHPITDLNHEKEVQEIPSPGGGWGKATRICVNSASQ